MSRAKRPLRILVAGGGIGGLCLAQGLRKSGIDVAVYERDDSAGLREQGYRISLKRAGCQALRDCLPESLYELAVATAIRQARTLALLDDQLEPIFAKPIPAVDSADGFGVNRLTLREILLTGLEDIVHLGKFCEGFALNDDGTVTARFSDGSTAEADLLVGADGTHSVVRRQFLPDAAVDDLEYAVWGKTVLTNDLLSAMPDILIDSFNRIKGPAGGGMSIATCRPKGSTGGAGLTPIPGYFSWTMSLPADRVGRDAASLQRFAYETVADWHPAVRRIVAEADVPATFAVAIRSARPVRPWPTKSVTLLGDAIHTMSPGRGEGANTALRDAMLLRRTLEMVASQDIPLVPAIAEYEAAMLKYGFDMVSDSLTKALWRPS